jgi:hypothetical protein
VSKVLAPPLSAPVGRLIDSQGDRPILPFSFDNKRCMAHKKDTAGERVVRGAQNWCRSCKKMSGSTKDVDSTPAADFCFADFCEVIFSVGQHSNLPLDRG